MPINFLLHLSLVTAPAVPLHGDNSIWANSPPMQICVMSFCHFGSLSWQRRKLHLRPSFSALCSKFSLRTLRYIILSIFPSKSTKFPIPAAAIQAHTITLPPPCFTVARKFYYWSWVLGFRYTKDLHTIPHRKKWRFSKTTNPLICGYCKILADLSDFFFCWCIGF